MLNQPLIDEYRLKYKSITVTASTVSSLRERVNVLQRERVLIMSRHCEIMLEIMSAEPAQKVKMLQDHCQERIRDAKEAKTMLRARVEWAVAKQILAERQERDAVMPNTSSCTDQAPTV